MTAIARNHILRAMPLAALSALQPHLLRVQLKKRTILQEICQVPDTVHFIESGMAMILARAQPDGDHEVGIVGRFGLVGVPAILGAGSSPFRCVMQISGEALRIDAVHIRRAIERDAAVRRLIMSYVHALLVQHAQTALCNLRHELVHRLARWLLLSSDRIDRKTVPLTHDWLSLSLGVRRAGITNALSKLEKIGAVGKSRGAVTIVDRAQLEACSCDCYRIIASEYARIGRPECVTTARAVIQGRRQFDDATEMQTRV